MTWGDTIAKPAASKKSEKKLHDLHTLKKVCIISFPVSYTHLDVYKRQVCGIEAMADGRRFVGSENFGDLYKHGFVPRLRPAPAAPAPRELSLQAAVERLIEVK